MTLSFEISRTTKNRSFVIVMKVFSIEVGVPGILTL